MFYDWIDYILDSHKNMIKNLENQEEESDNEDDYVNYVQ